MYITIEELFTHLYPEQVEAIQGDDERFLTAAVSGAIVQAKGYLHRYDIPRIFGATGDSRDPFLLIILKDIAVWHYINIANPNIDTAIREKRYNDATAWLRGVQKGDIIPDFPIPENPDGTDRNTTGFQIGSNPKRSNHII
jgi:phage gp36-like protein